MIFSHRNKELLALLVIHMLFGFEVAQICSVTLPTSSAINVNNLVSSEDLVPVLKVGSEQERYFIADHVFTYIRRLRPKQIENVGALAKLRIPVDEVDRTPRLGSLTDRLTILRNRAEAQHLPAPLNVALLSVYQLQAAKAFLVVRTRDRFREDLIFWAAILCAGIWGVHITWRVRLFRGDQSILPIIALLTAIGFLMMATVRDPVRDTELFLSYVEGSFCGCAALIAITSFEWQHRIRRFAYIPLLMSFGLWVALLIFGRGPGTSDAKINLGPFQPGDLIRFLLLLFLSSYFAHNWRLIRQSREVRQLHGGIQKILVLPKVEYVIPLFAAIAITFLFYFLQKDLGPALIMGCVFVTLYGIARARVLLVVLALAFVSIVIGIGLIARVPHIVRDRVDMMMSPWDNSISGGDQLAESLWAMSSGGIKGSGLGFGETSHVPASHTDLVMSAVGEELGVPGFSLVVIALGLLMYRGFAAGSRAFTIYESFLALSCVFALSFQILLITAGTVGLFPLSGVVVPFVSFGRISMVVNFAIAGIFSSVSSRSGQNDVSFPMRRPGRIVIAILSLSGIFVFGRAIYIQAFEAESISLRNAKILERDGVRRIHRNPRLVAVLRRLGRGTIFDRAGLPIATSKPELLLKYQATFASLGINVQDIVRRGGDRYYPFGMSMFHLIGDSVNRRNWGAGNAAYVERDYDSLLQGFTLVDRPAARAKLFRLIQYGYRDGDPSNANDALLNHDVTLTIDAAFTERIAGVLMKQLLKADKRRGAIVVIDARSGDALAIVSLPSPLTDGNDQTNEGLLDRARFGLYPPGSTFKMVTAIAALKRDPALAEQRYTCSRLSQGRVGATVRGVAIRDDIEDSIPHGKIEMSRALAVSCNAFFAQLAVNRIGPQDLFKTGRTFGLTMASPDTAERLSSYLAQAAFGQGEVLASPVQMARVAATIANAGSLPPFSWIQPTMRSDPLQVVSSEGAKFIARSLRTAVQNGTASAAASSTIVIAGKTGTAQTSHGEPHSWFAGFAPYPPGDRSIAFSILVENGGYGGKVAAPLAVEVVSAAVESNILLAPKRVDAAVLRPMRNLAHHP